MAYNDTKNIGDLINATDWNDHTDVTDAISGSYYGHSGNKAIHSPSSNLKTWFDTLYESEGNYENTVGWVSIQDGNGINDFSGKISGASAITLSVDEGAILGTVSSNALQAYNYINTSGNILGYYKTSAQKYHQAYLSGQLAHPRVTLTGETYLTLSDQQITLAKLDMNETNLVAGTNITLSTNTLNVDDAFLINDGDDSTSGTLTAKSYVGPISSTAISSASLKLGASRVTTILDEDDMSTNSATALATQQSIKKYVDDNSEGTVGWVTIEDGVGINDFTGKISGASAVTLSVDQGSILGTVSSQAKQAYNFTNASGAILGYYKASAQKYHQAYLSGQRVQDAFDHNIFITSSSAIARFQESGTSTQHLNIISISTQNISGVTEHNVMMDCLPGATECSLQGWVDNYGSAVLLSGANVTIGGPTGSINISKSYVAVREATDEHALLWRADIVASSNITMGEGSHYLYIDYNGGSPKYAHRTTGNFNGTTQIHFARIYNDWDTGYIPETHIVEGGYRINDLGNKVLKRFSSYGTERQTGIITASSQTTGHPSSLQVTTGTLWRALNKFTTTAFDAGSNHDITALNHEENWFSVTGCTHTVVRGNHVLVQESTGNDGIYIVSSTTIPSSAGYKRIYIWSGNGKGVSDTTADGHLHDNVFTYWWRDGSSGWYNSSGQVGLNIDYYDDNSGTLNTLTSNRYGVHWVYVDITGDVNILYGQGDYTLAQAEDSITPATIPSQLDVTSILAARVIVQQGQTSLDDATYSYPWTTSFTAGNVDQHNDLGGIQGGTTGEYYHLTATDDTNFDTLTDGSDASTLHVHDGRYTASGVVNKDYIDTISSNAIQAYNYTNASGGILGYYKTSAQKYHQAYQSSQIAFYDSAHVNHDETTNFVASEHINHLSGYLSGAKISANTIRFTQFIGGTDATASQLETLTDGSDADALHIHPSIDGAPSSWTAPTSASGVTLIGVGKISGALKVTLSDIPQDVIKSGANWQKAYISTSTGIFANASHTHDDRYYTETEVNAISSSIITHISHNYYPSSVGALYDNISGLIDVAVMHNRADGDLLTWDTTQNKWSSQAAPQGGISSWQAFTAGDGSIAGMTGAYAISGDGALTISVPGYLVISSQAKQGKDYADASGSILGYYKTSAQKYHQAYASAQIAFYDSKHVDHDATTNFVADEHIDHSGVDITAGTNLNGGGDITSTRTINLDTTLEGLVSVSSQNISSNTLKIGAVRVNEIYDEDSFASDSATGLATQQSIKAFINTISGALDTKIDALSDTPTNWTTLTATADSGIAPFEGAIGVSGSTAVSLEVVAYSTISSNAKQGKDFANTSGSVLGYYKASSTKYGTAYTHSQDNTQAHSDYLLNNNDDATTGSLTAKTFYGPVSGIAISTASLKVGATRVTSILDEDSFASDSATSLATQQSIKAYVNTVSGALDTKIDAMSDTPTTWGTLTEGTGIAPITGVGISGSGDNDVTVLGYATISSQAKQGKDFADASGSVLGYYKTSSSKYGTAYTHSQDNTQAHTDYLVNNADDTTTGSLTAVTFYGNLSGASASSAQYIGKKIYGGTTAGDDLTLYGNTSDTYPNIVLQGGGNIVFDTDGDTFFYDNGTNALKFSYSAPSTYISTDTAKSNIYLDSKYNIVLRSGTTQLFQFYRDGDDNIIEGGTTANDDLKIKANTSDSYPYMIMYGAGDVRVYSNADITFWEQSTQDFKFSYASNVSTIEGGATSGDDLKLKANTLDDYPYIRLYGSGQICLSGSKIGISSSSLQAHTISCAVFQGPVAAGGGIDNVVEDTTPQLGGELDGQSSYGLVAIPYISSTIINTSDIRSKDPIIINSGATQIFKLRSSGDWSYLWGQGGAGNALRIGAGTDYPFMDILDNDYVHVALQDATDEVRFLHQTTHKHNFNANGVHFFAETTTPSAKASMGAIYTKSDNKFYFQDGAGDEHDMMLISGHTDTNINTPASGEVLMWDGADWENKMPAMNFNVANIMISAQQNINVTRFTCPAGKKAYIWQAAACNSGGAMVGDLCIELLSGSTSVYKTSSAELQQGSPLGVSDGGKTEIRFMYSGGGASGIQYGTGFMQVSVY